MPRRGRRKRIARNVYQDSSGISLIIRRYGHTEEVRFAPGTPVAEIRHEEQRRMAKIETTLGPKPTHGSVAQAIRQYLETLPEGAYKRDRQRLLAPWRQAIGTRPFAGLRTAELQVVIDGWASKAPNTINKRISALRLVWRRIAPDHVVPHPIERLRRLSDPDPEIDRARDLSLVVRVLEAVSDQGFADSQEVRDQASKARVRLRALAWTAQPASLLCQVKPEHVRWSRDPVEMYVQPRRKGKGVGAAWVPLLPQAAEAMRDLFARGAHGGTWHRGVLRLAWQRALKRVQRELVKEQRADDAARLAGMRVYDLRHSILTAMGTASGDIYAVAEVARHADIRTTRRYMRGAASARMRLGVAALAATLPPMSAAPSEPPQTGATSALRSVDPTGDTATKVERSREEVRTKQARGRTGPID